MKPLRSHPWKILVALSGVALACGAFLLLRAGREARRSRELQASERRTVALLVPHAGGCQLLATQLPEGEAREVVTLPSDCAGAQLIFSPTGGHALAWFAAAEVDPRDLAIFEVDLAARKLRRLGAPEGGDVETFAYDATGRLLAFVVDQDVELVQEGDERRVVREGKLYPAHPGADGVDAVARTLEWQDKGWVEIEAQATRCCADAAPGPQVLPTYHQLVGDPALRELLAAPERVRLNPPKTVQDPALLRKLAQEIGPSREDEPTPEAYVRLQLPGWSTSLVAVGSGFPVRFALGPLYLERDRRLQRVATQPDGSGVVAGDILELTGSGRFALVADAFTGTRPVGLDMRTGKVVLDERLAFAARFWPPGSRTP
jgi:hypothetical protein